MPLREFWRRYVVLKGYRDGWVGLLLCGLMGWYTFRTYMAGLSAPPEMSQGKVLPIETTGA